MTMDACVSPPLPGKETGSVAEQIHALGLAISGFGRAQVEHATQRVKTVAHAMEEIQSGSPENRPLLYRRMITNLLQHDIIKKEQLGREIPAEYPGDDAFNTLSIRCRVLAETALGQLDARDRELALRENQESQVPHYA